MGVLTSTDIIAEAMGQAGARTSTDYPTATAYRQLNFVYRHICNPNVYRHRELRSITQQALVADDALYVIAAATNVATMGLHSVVVFNPASPARRHRLRPVRDRDVHEMYEPSGRPRLYATAWDGTDSIQLFPAPSTTYAGWTLDIRRWRAPTPFSSGAPAVSAIHENFDEVLVQGLVWRIWRYYKEFEKAEVAKMEFAQLLGEIPDRDSFDALDDDWGPEIVVTEVMDEAYGV